MPPQGAPNVLLIMTDDQGYGVSGTFGGVIPTPALDRIEVLGSQSHQAPAARAGRPLMEPFASAVEYYLQPQHRPWVGVESRRTRPVLMLPRKYRDAGCAHAFIRPVIIEMISSPDVSLT